MAVTPASRPQSRAAGTPPPRAPLKCCQPHRVPESAEVTADCQTWFTSSPTTVAQTAPTAVAGTVARVSSTGSSRSAHHTTASSRTSPRRYSSQWPNAPSVGGAQ